MVLSTVEKDLGLKDAGNFREKTEKLRQKGLTLFLERRGGELWKGKVEWPYSLVGDRKHCQDSIINLLGEQPPCSHRIQLSVVTPGMGVTGGKIHSLQWAAAAAAVQLLPPKAGCEHHDEKENKWLWPWVPTRVPFLTHPAYG